jgi:hypothetical protein
MVKTGLTVRIALTEKIAMRMSVPTLAVRRYPD